MIAVNSGEDPIKGPPPRWMWTSGKETGHPHGLKGSKLDLWVQKPYPAKPGRAMSGIGAGFQSGTAIPDSFPSKSTNAPDESAGRSSVYSHTLFQCYQCHFHNRT